MGDLVPRCAVIENEFLGATGRREEIQQRITVHSYPKAHGELLDDDEEGVEGSFRHQTEGIKTKGIIGYSISDPDSRRNKCTLRH